VKGFYYQTVIFKKLLIILIYEEKKEKEKRTASGGKRGGTTCPAWEGFFLVRARSGKKRVNLSFFGKGRKNDY